MSNSQTTKYNFPWEVIIMYFMGVVSGFLAAKTW